ncbi:MAG TPA: hypothetical protein PKJ98_14485 [Verrucomicrobiota bacterium]|nr:hypothetical protein [Verrucomicrobiota bacterium]
MGDFSECGHGKGPAAAGAGRSQEQIRKWDGAVPDPGRRRRVKSCC